MKKLISILTLATISLVGCTKKEEGLTPLNEYQTVYKGDVFITGRTDMSVFKNITTIDGSLTLTDFLGGHPDVNNTAPVTDISALKNLKRVIGSVTLQGLSKISSLETLSNLAKIEGNLTLQGLSKISSLETLNSLEKIDGNLTILNCNFADFKGFEKLSSLKNVDIVTLGSDISFKGFGKGISIERLNISSGSTLKQIKDLESLGKVQFFNIINIPNLTSIGDMSNINITKQMVISNCPNLTTIGKINTADQYASIHILDSNIEDLSCLSTIKKLNQLLLINNKNLKTLNTENLTNVGNLTMHTNANLKSLKGFENCQIGNISLQNNVRLENIEHLKNLKKCYAITLTDNTSLKSIDALSNIGEESNFFNYIAISGNIVLNDLCPLSSAVKKLLKNRETNVHVTLPIITNNATNMSYEDMLKTCP
jgi:hypothetical protein